MTLLAAVLAAAACSQEPARDAPQTPDPQTPPANEEPSFSDGRIWTLDVQADSARLAYGTPQTDDVAIMLGCDVGSGRVGISFTRADQPEARPWPFTLRAGGQSASFEGDVTPIELGENAVSIETEAPLSSPPFAALANADGLTLEEFGRSVEMDITPAQRGDVDRFFAACRER